MLGEIEKRTLIPYALTSEPSPNKPIHDTQEKGTPYRRIPNPARSCIQFSWRLFGCKPHQNLRYELFLTHNVLQSDLHTDVAQFTSQCICKDTH